MGAIKIDDLGWGKQGVEDHLGWGSVTKQTTQNLAVLGKRKSNRKVFGELSDNQLLIIRAWIKVRESHSMLGSTRWICQKQKYVKRLAYFLPTKRSPTDLYILRK